MQVGGYRIGLFFPEVALRFMEFDIMIRFSMGSLPSFLSTSKKIPIKPIKTNI